MRCSHNSLLKRKKHRLLTLALTLLSSLAHAQGSGSPTTEYDWGSRVILESAVGNDHAEGQINFLAPLFGNDNTLMFLYPSLGLSSNVDPGFSLGMGVRHFCEDLNAIIGFGLFFDRYDSRFGNQYNQLGLTGEVLTERFDFRFNYYIPESDRNLIDSRSVSSRSQSETFAAPYATGHNILQDITTTTTTVNQLFERYEESMQGLDTEFGILIPVVDQFAECRVFVGYYDFENQFGADLTGVKARAEMRFSEKLAIDATFYEDEEVAGDNWVFGFRMSLPIYPENMVDGRSPFEGSFDGIFGNKASASGGAGRFPFSSTSSLNRPLRQRMTEEVLRANRVQTSESDFIENMAERDIRTRSKTETKTIETGIIFVNNGGAVGNGIRAGSASGNGTAERPVDGVGLGAEKLVSRLGGSGTVYVQGNRPAYVEDVSVGFDGSSFSSNNGVGVRNVVFTSSYKGIGACGGFVFGGNTARPTVNGFDIRGGSSGSVNSATLNGFRTTGLVAGPNFGTGIYAENVPDLTISCNIIHSTLDDANALKIQYGQANVGLVEIAENTIRSDGENGDGIDFDGFDDAFVTMVIRDNVVTTTNLNSDGIDTETAGFADVLIDIIRTRITTQGEGSSVIDAEAYEGSILDVLVADSMLRTFGADSDVISLSSDDDAELIATINRNSINAMGPGSDGIDTFSLDFSLLDVLSEGNTIRAASDSIDAFAVEDSLQFFVSIDDRLLAPVLFDAVEGATFFSAVDGGRVVTDGEVGVTVNAEDDAFHSTVLVDTTIQTTGDFAAGYVIVNDSSNVIDAFVEGNRITTTGVTADGIGIVPLTSDINFVLPGLSNSISTTSSLDVFVVPAGAAATGTVIVNGVVVTPPVSGDF